MSTETLLCACVHVPLDVSQLLYKVLQTCICRFNPSPIFFAAAKGYRVCLRLIAANLTMHDMVVIKCASGGVGQWLQRHYYTHARTCPSRCLIIINPRRACAAGVTVLGLSFPPSVRPFLCLSVCYHVFCHYAQHGGQKAIPTGSVPHWHYF